MLFVTASKSRVKHFEARKLGHREIISESFSKLPKFGCVNFCSMLLHHCKYVWSLILLPILLMPICYLHLQFACNLVTNVVISIISFFCRKKKPCAFTITIFQHLIINLFKDISVIIHCLMSSQRRN